MKIGQVIFETKQRVIAVSNGSVWLCRDFGGGTRDIIQGLKPGETLTEAMDILLQAAELLGGEQDLLDGNMDAILTKPINPPEAWACGVTYKRQALEHDADALAKLGKTEKLYHFVYAAERAEVFFKGLDRTLCGPNDSLWIRGDSNQTLPESELVAVLGQDGLPIAYTLGNDMTAWDIELNCPLYLNQAKIWKHSGSIGPFIQPIESFGSPYECQMNCKVLRDGEVVVDSDGGTSDIKRSIEELCYYMNFNSPVEAGSVLFTGTACVVPHDFCLAAGDIAIVSMRGFGELRNPISMQSIPVKDFLPR